MLELSHSALQNVFGLIVSIALVLAVVLQSLDLDLRSKSRSWERVFYVVPHA